MLSDARHQRPLAGIVYILAGIGLLSAMDAVAKVLVEAGYPAIEVIALRGWLITGLLLAWLPRAGGPRALRSHRWPMHLVRSLFGLAAPFFFFTALTTMPLADVTVLFFASTFIIAGLSVPILKEPIGLHRWAAIGTGFIGVIVALQPGTSAFQMDSLFALLASVSYAMLFISGRWLSGTETVYRIVFYYNLITALLATLFTPFVWLTPDLPHLALIGLMAALALAGHTMMTMAFSAAPVGVLAPFEYSGLVWATLFGFLFWRHVPNGVVQLGALIIVASGLYMVYRENRVRRRIRSAR